LTSASLVFEDANDTLSDPSGPVTNNKKKLGLKSALHTFRTMQDFNEQN